MDPIMLLEHGASLRLADLDALDAATLATYASWLGLGEARRLARFVRPARRRQFVVGRALLRQMLGQLLHIAPADVMLEERPGMAPRLAMPACAPIGFSISHSARWVACAISPSCQLGLDIEAIAMPRDFLALAEQAFDAGRSAALAQLPPATQARQFYRLWCEHEARIKLGQEVASVTHIPHADLAIVVCYGRSFTEQLISS